VPAHRFAGQAAADDRWGVSGGSGAAPPDVKEMGRTKSHKKNIACLESLWDGNIESRLSVVPLLELASRVDEIRFSYLTCNTEDELEHNLDKLKNKRGYGILYLACHGKPGELVLDESSVDIQKLAGFMGDGFTNWVIHFGSCSTIKIEHARLSRFIAATQVSMILGYRQDVAWIDSAAIDLLLFDGLQDYKDMRRFWGHFKHRYPDLISITGLRAVLR